MIENVVYCYVNGFLKCSVIKNSSYIVGNKKFARKTWILNMRKKKEKKYLCKSNHQVLQWKKITKEMGMIITKSIYRWNNRMELRKWITRRKLAHFRSTIDASRSRTRRIQFIINILLQKVFLFQLT